MSSVPDFSAMRLSSIRTQVGYISMPPAPSTSGSMISAAAFSSRVNASKLSSVSCSRPAAGNGMVSTSKSSGS